MDRGSSKHSPRLDEQMSAEVAGLVSAGRQTHAQEWAEAEPSGEDQPEVDRVPDGTLVGGTPEGLDAEEVELRSRLAAVLPRSAFPGDRDALVGAAASEDAPEALLDVLRGLPEGGSYATVGDVWRALGHTVEDHRF